MQSRFHRLHLALRWTLQPRTNRTKIILATRTTSALLMTTTDLVTTVSRLSVFRIVPIPLLFRVARRPDTELGQELLRPYTVSRLRQAFLAPIKILSLQSRPFRSLMQMHRTPTNGPYSSRTKVAFHFPAAKIRENCLVYESTSLRRWLLCLQTPSIDLPPQLSTCLNMLVRLSLLK